MPFLPGRAGRNLALLAFAAVLTPLPAAPPVAVWSYRDLAGAEGEQAAFFRFAASHRIGELFLGGVEPLPGGEARWTRFLQEARARGITVSLVLGRTWWLQPARRAEAMAAVRTAAAFCRQGPGGPVGLHLDLEPQALPEWDRDRVRLAGDYLDFLEAVRTELGGGPSLTVDIPVWWSRLQVARGGRTRPLSAWVLALADRVVLMDYRNTAEGILAGAAGDLALAAQGGRRVILGLAAHCDRDPETRRTSFCSLGKRALETALADVDRRLAGDRGYGGLAVFTYEDWQDLPEGPGAASKTF